jgi:ABC-type uncharacterized transport system substrate-binding protein
MQWKRFAGYFLLTLLLLLNSNLTGSAKIKESKTTRHFKILHIMSYHSPWEWTDSLFDGFKKALVGYNIEYKTFQMDTKRNSLESQKATAGEQARAMISNWKPDLVYTTDDDAQKYVTKYYVNTNIPFVFSAVNADPETYGFNGSKNITGVLEIEHFVASIKLLKKIVPHAKKIAVVIDDGPMWSPVVERMKAKQRDVPEIQIVRWDTIRTFAEYQQKIKDYQSTVDAVALLGIFTFRGQNGQNVPFQQVLQWTAVHSRLPDFSFWKDRVSYGTLCAMSVSGYEQGLSAGKIAKGILIDGKSPAEFPMEPTTKGEPLINLARAKRIGLKINAQVLLSSKVIEKFEWDKK